jgi:predicted amidophosphoribosyltransferase
MHPWRQVLRGFNQAELLARSLVRARSLETTIQKSRTTPTPIVRALRRVKWTASQTSQHSLAARARNVRDAFELVDQQAVAGRSVLLVDDVMTSGSTLRVCARAIRHAKPVEINAIVLAAADPRHHRDAVRAR